VATGPQTPRSTGKRGGRGRPASVRRGVVRVDPDFVVEYPEADASCTEAYATLLTTGDVLFAEHERHVELVLGISHTAAHALGVLDGAGEPLTPSQISERMVISSATMTSLLDVLERRGWIRRTPNPEDRRSLLIEITLEGRTAADTFIPGLHKLERRVMSVLSERERAQLVGLLAKVLASANEIAGEAAEPLTGLRNRPARLA